MLLTDLLAWRPAAVDPERLKVQAFAGRQEPKQQELEQESITLKIVGDYELEQNDYNKHGVDPGLGLP